MSTATVVPSAQVGRLEDEKISQNEILLQVKALQELRKSLRRATLKGKVQLKNVQSNDLTKDCQVDIKQRICWVRKGKFLVFYTLYFKEYFF